MSYVIYNNRTKHRLETPNASSWAEQRIAKAVLTKAIKSGKAVEGEWTVASYDDWRAVDTEIEVISVMSGKPVKIRQSDRGSRASDPSMEGYWTL